MTRHTEKANRVRKALGLSKPESGWQYLRSHTLIAIEKLGIVDLIAKKVKLLKESKEFTEAMETEVNSCSRIAKINEEIKELEKERSILRKERIVIRQKLFNLGNVGRVLLRYSLLDAYVSLLYKEEKKKISAKKQGQDKLFTEEYVETLRSRITELESLMGKKGASDSNEADNKL